MYKLYLILLFCFYKAHAVKQPANKQNTPKTPKQRVRHVDSPATVYIGRKRTRVMPTRTPKASKYGLPQVKNTCSVLHLIVLLVSLSLSLFHIVC